MAFLEVNGIQKSFGKTEVLKNVGFSMEKGEVLAIIGSSGSGKTTLLRCLNFLERPDGGSFSVDGEELFNAQTVYSDSEKREKRLRFGLVFQQFNLFPQYTVLKNVSLARELLQTDGKKLPKDEKKRIFKEIEDNSLELLRTVGLEEKAHDYPCNLSGGQQQRVAIARALALSPEILCFDEPTSALDPELTGEVLRVIRGLKSSDRTMIVVTHEMNFARGVADKVIFMADGIIEEEGTPDEVFTSPKSPRTKAFLEKSLENI
ncbi:MAG TPA: polar amino acid ABC transporter ATP-binding protein [Ruminococcaceae bacterium]|nr:polar amino acid ABC transporter ATP-binding protein [Oscillospiraceae bacterium]